MVRSGAVTGYESGAVSNTSSSVDAILVCPITLPVKHQSGGSLFTFYQLSLLQAYTTGSDAGVSCKFNLRTPTDSVSTLPATSTAGTMTDMLVASEEDFLTVDPYVPMVATMVCTLKANVWPKNQLIGYVAGFYSAP